MEEKTKKDYLGITMLIALIVLLLFMASCSSTKFVPVESIKTEYVVQESIKIDSIYSHDSIYIKEKNDTVLIYKDKIRYKYMYINKCDTVIKVDSIPYTIEVEKKLKKSELAFMQLGKVFAGLLSVAFFACLFFLARKFRI